MKIMATFDRSKFSESILPMLERMARLPEAEFVLLSVTHHRHGQLEATPQAPVVAIPGGTGTGPAIVVDAPAPRFAETGAQAIQRSLDEILGYLGHLVTRLPPGPHYDVQAYASGHPAATIIEQAHRQRPDVIVMATHGRSGLVHALFGDVAEQVVRSSVAPVLLIHPEEVQASRRTSAEA